MKITIESDGPVIITPADSSAPAGREQAGQPDPDGWLVFGIRDAGEPVPLAVIPGRDALAYRNDRFVGGVWEESVTADGPRDAARAGAAQARAKLDEAEAWPARGAA